MKQEIYEIRNRIKDHTGKDFEIKDFILKKHITAKIIL